MIANNNRGILLISQIHGRTNDLCDKREEYDVSRATDETSTIVDPIYNRDPLSAVTLVHQEINGLINTLRADHESYRNLES